MSQVLRITRVEHAGSPVYLGDDTSTGDAVPVWSDQPGVIMRWLVSAWRCRWNQKHTTRKKYAPAPEGTPVDEVVKAPFGPAILVPVTSDGHVDDWSDREAREECSWLRSVPALILHAATRDEDTAWFSAIRRNKTLAQQGKPAGALPGFKDKRDDTTASFTCYYNKGKNARFEKYSKKHGCIIITGQNRKTDTPDGYGCGWSLRLHVRLSEPVREYTSIIVNPSRRTVTLVNPPEPVQRGSVTQSSIALDAGVTHAVTDSNGEHHDLPKDKLARLDARITGYQKDLARKRRVNPNGYRSSNRYKSVRRLLVQAYAERTRVLRDYYQKLTTLLVRTTDMIIIENLDLVSMSKRVKARPDPEHEGHWLRNGQSGKTGLNRALRGASLGLLGSLLEYKASVTDGCRLIRVEPMFTSQRCAACGSVDARSRESQAAFKCTACGHEANADVNAALNIQLLGLTGEREGHAVRFNQHGELVPV